MPGARTLGPFTCLLLGLTTIVGSGIFALPPILFAAAGPLSFLSFLCAAGVVSLVGLMTAEAAGTTDRPGGAYEYARLAFGPRAGFAVAWLAWSNLVLAWSTVSLALVKLLDVLQPGLGSGRSAQVLASAEILLLGALNLRGARAGALVVNALTVAKLLPLCLFVLLGLLAARPGSFTGALPRLHEAGVAGFAVATYRCIFAAGGFENIGVVAGEVKDPQRTIPRAVLLAILGSSVLYALVQLAATVAVPDLGAVAGEAQRGGPGSLALPLCAAQAGLRLCGPACGAAAHALLLWGAGISMIGFCAGVAIVTPRYLQAMAGDGFVPRALVGLSPRGTPARAIGAATVLAVGAVWAADFLTLLDVAILFSLVQHLTTTLAAWRLRRILPAAGRFIAPGGPVVPGLAVGAIVLLCALAFWPAAGGVDRGHFVALGLLLLLGAAVAGLTRVARL